MIEESAGAEWSTDWWDEYIKESGWRFPDQPGEPPRPKEWPNVKAAIRKYKIGPEPGPRHWDKLVIGSYADYGFTLREKEDA